MLRKVVRELFILRKLTEIDNNIYTTKIIDIILPLKCNVQAEDIRQAKEVLDLDKITHVFVVMDMSDFDLKSMIDNLSSNEL